MPVSGLIVIPVGGVIRLKLSLSAGTSGSDALTEISLGTNSSITTGLVGTTRAGGLFVSTIVTLKVVLALRLPGLVPSSVTTTVMLVVVPPNASPGVQVNTPLIESIFAPPGGLDRLNVNLFAGRSGSVALAETVNGNPSITVWGTIGTGNGDLLTSRTVTVIVSD